MATFVLLKRIRDFKRIHENVVIDVRESLEFDAVENIRKGLTDCGYFGLHLSAPEAPEGIEVVPLTREELVVWVDRTSPYAAKEALSPADLADAVVPLWVGISNDLETIYREFFALNDVEVDLSPRYCSSREDFFLNRVTPQDVVILTRGSEDINAIKVRDERVALPFATPMYAYSYIAFPDEGRKEILDAFKEFLVEHADDEDD